MIKRRILIASLVLIAASSCNSGEETPATPLTGGDPERGRTLITKYGCGVCHEIPGIPGAAGIMGPTLGGIGLRPALYGGLPNEPANMVKWIRDPKAINPGTLMPDLNIGEQEASDMAAYLYTLQSAR